MKILVIDDEASTRDLLKMSLESDGYTVFVAEDGPKGLEIFARENPPVVLTDIKICPEVRPSGKARILSGAFDVV